MAKEKKSLHLVDPEVAGILDAYKDLNITAESYLHFRGKTAVDTPSDVTVEEIYIDNLYDDSQVKLIIVKPAKPSTEPQPLIYGIHGGGMVIGNAEMLISEFTLLAQQYNFIGVSVEYRLAPEHVQPAQLHDCYSGIKWCIDNASALNIDPSKVAVTGLSAGGALAAGLALYIRDQQEFTIHHLKLTIPMLDDKSAINEDHPYNGEFAWTKENNYFGWKSVLNQEPGSDGISEYYVPARAKSLAGLPNTYISIGSIELFADEALAFAKQLMHDGVLVELHLYPGYHHLGLSVPTAYHAQRENESGLNALLRSLNIEVKQFA